ncbi:MAG TPA: hypothetical protein VM901_13350 [Bdellovibrionota bacterium]|jgi:alpha-beta hydrolase superfamily lysophospholipase|nr:hypothetical protein [Bdellovibrionota bacterium]
MGGVDYVVLPYAPGTDTRLYFQPSLSIKSEHKWHIFEYSANDFEPKRYFEELEEFIQLHCHEDILVLVGHSSACRLSLEFLNHSLCYPDAIAWISPMLEPAATRGYLYQDLDPNTNLTAKLDHWCKKLINQDCAEIAHALIAQGDTNEPLFAQFEEYLWQLRPAKIPMACTRLPIFALSGGLDPINSFEGLSLQLKDFYHKTITELTDIGHCAFIESPNVLSFLLDDFVSTIKDAQSSHHQDSDPHQKTPPPDLE